MMACVRFGFGIGRCASVKYSRCSELFDAVFYFFVLVSRIDRGFPVFHCVQVVDLELLKT